MSQDFHGDVGQVAAGDINNFGVQINVGSRTEARALLPAQRKELHQLRAKCEELGDDPWAVWQEVHAQLSVTTLDEVTAAQFVQAKGVIQARLERLQEEADKRHMIAKIRSAAEEKDAQQELSNFCELSFGRTQVDLLKRSELSKVLEFIQGFQAQAPVVEQAEPSAEPALTQPARLPLREFLITYKANAFWLFMFGVIVDRFWFR